MATTTITTTSQEDARLVAAFGWHLNLPGNATAAQIKADLRRYMVEVVKTYEQREVVQAAIDGVTTINPT